MAKQPPIEIEFTPELVTEIIEAWKRKIENYKYKYEYGNDLFGMAPTPKSRKPIETAKEFINELAVKGTLPTFYSIVRCFNYLFEEKKYQKLTRGIVYPEYITVEVALQLVDICLKDKETDLWTIALLVYKGYGEKSICEYFYKYKIPKIKDNTDKIIDNNEPIKFAPYPTEEIINSKPLDESTVSDKLTYCLFSRYDLDFNIKILKNAQKDLFWHYVCILYYRRKDLYIFEQSDFEKFVAKCLEKRNDPIFRKAAYISFKENENDYYRERLNDLLEAAFFYEEYYGKEEYEDQVRYYTDKVNNPEAFNENELDLLSATVESIDDIYFDEQEFEELRLMLYSNRFYKKDSALLNSIVSLMHAVPNYEYNRILAYYLIPEKRIKLAGYTKLDACSDDPYIVQPKLERPITKQIIKYLTTYAKRYKNKDYIDIVSKWLKLGDEGKEKLHTLFDLVINLQIKKDIIFIEQNIFEENFKTQIEAVRQGKLYRYPKVGDFFPLIKLCNVSTRDLLRTIIVLIQEGYNANDIWIYYKENPISNL
ncbi:MAG: hypothetical protein NC131_11365 [Roseburia sp.]|nr:hypothetical protein [Roseburia sp.]